MRITYLRNIIILLMCAISGCLLIGCPKSNNEKTATTNPTPSTVEKLTTLKVGYIPIAECTPLYIGLTKGYFKEQGLNVELQAMKGGAAILPAVQRGDLDVGFTNVVSLVLLNSKLLASNKTSADPEYLLSLVGGSYERTDHINHALLIKSGTKFSISDIAHPTTKVALNTPRNVEELMLRRFLKKKGVTATQLNIVPIGFPDMLPALDRGDVNVASVVEPFIEPAVRSGKYTLLAHQYLDVSGNTVIATYVVSRKWLTNNKDVGARFVAAFNKATEFIKNNEPEARQVLGSYTRIKKEDLPVIGLPAFEQGVDRASLEVTANEMVQHKFIKSVPSLDDMLAEQPKK